MNLSLSHSTCIVPDPSFPSRRSVPSLPSPLQPTDTSPHYLSKKSVTMPEEVQSFRLSGATDVVKIPVHQIQDSKVVIWEDIQLYFPRLLCIKNGDTAVPPKRDSKYLRMNPVCIEYFPNDTLDVIVSTQDEREQSTFGTIKYLVDHEPLGAKRLENDGLVFKTDFASMIPHFQTMAALETRPALLPLSSSEMRDPEPFRKSWYSNDTQLKSSNGAAASSHWSAYWDKESRVRDTAHCSPIEDNEFPSSASMCSSSTEVELAHIVAGDRGNSSSSAAGDSQNYSYENLDSLRKDAEAGVAQAQYLLGEKYDKGEVSSDGDERQDGDLSTASNLSKAFQWFLKAANQGHVLAQRNLGNMYKHGHGVPEDYTKAQEWYKKAGDRGDEYSLMTLAFMKKNGQGGARDVGQFFELAGKALAPLLMEGHRFP